MMIACQSSIPLLWKVPSSMSSHHLYWRNGKSRHQYSCQNWFPTVERFHRRLQTLIVSLWRSQSSQMKSLSSDRVSNTFLQYASEMLRQEKRSTKPKSRMKRKQILQSSSISLLELDLQQIWGQSGSERPGELDRNTRDWIHELSPKDNQKTSRLQNRVWVSTRLLLQQKEISSVFAKFLPSKHSRSPHLTCHPTPFIVNNICLL